jgi:hypothetical protein
MDKDILKVIADNPSLTDALKKLLLAEFELETPQSDLGVTDEVLGQIFRARLVGKAKVESAFRKISSFKTEQDVAVKVNLAR